MNRKNTWIKTHWEIVTACGLGAIAFIILYGTDILNPLYIDWLMKGENDLSQHYFGWKLFRQDSWRFPIGLMKNIVYPTEVSVIYTDSIPLFAILFKLLSPILPENFQYFGWYGLLSFILQGGISAVLLRKYLKSRINVVFGSCFFIFSPVVLQRMFIHTSLAGNWLLLFLIAALVYRDYLRKNNKALVLFWSSAGILCVGVHFYYILMGAFIWLGFCGLEWVERRAIKQSLKAGLAYGFTSLAVMYLLGGFSKVISPRQQGLGSAQFDLLGFINPMGNSAFLKGTFENTKFESFAYLGMGIIILFIVAVCLTIVKKREIMITKKYIVFGVIGILSLLFAFSNIITCDGKEILAIPIPEILSRMWSVFRATGRFAWIVFYFIMLYAVCMTERLTKKGWGYFLLLFCLIIQLVDLSGMMRTIRENYKEPYRYESRLQDERWHTLAESGKYKHVVIITDWGHDLIYEFTKYASDYHMTVNRFYLARPIDENIIKADIQRALESDEKDCIYIVAKQDTWMFERYGIVFEELDSRGVGIKPE